MAAVASILMMIPFFSCDESLPPPEDPFSVLNVELKLLMSQGMVLAASGDQKTVGDAAGIFLLSPDDGAQPGMKVR